MIAVKETHQHAIDTQPSCTDKRSDINLEVYSEDNAYEIAELLITVVRHA